MSKRKNEIYNSDQGQNIHVVIDNKPYFTVIGQKIDTFNDEANYYESMYRCAIPYDLLEGKHTIRSFLCRSYNESLKNKEAFDCSCFYFKKKQKIH